MPHFCVVLTIMIGVLFSGGILRGEPVGGDFTVSLSRWNAVSGISAGHSQGRGIFPGWVTNDGKPVLASEGWFSHHHEGDELPLFFVCSHYAVGVALVALLLLSGITFWSWKTYRRMRRQAEKLQEKEAHIQMIMDNLPLGLALSSLSPTPHFIFMNDFFPKLHRTTREALQDPEKYWDVVYEDPEVRERIRKQMKESCASKDPSRMRWDAVPISRQGMETRYVSIRKIPLPGGDKVVSLVWDVTDEVLKTEKLNSNERLLQIAGRTAKIGGWSTDLKTEMCTLSDQVLMIFGLNEGNTYPLHKIFQFFVPEFRGKMEAFHESCSKKGLSADETVEVITFKGDRRWIRITGEPVYDESGNIIRIQGSIQDITEVFNIRAQLQHSQKMESIGRLAGGVAHDFNNMLSVIMGYTELAMRRVEPESALENDLTQIRTAATRSAGVVRQLLAFARKQPVTPVLLDLNESIGQTMKMLHHMIGENVELVWKPGVVPFKVRIDRSQLDQILVNLCVNADDAIEGIGKIFIETGYVKIDQPQRLHLDVILPGEYVTLEVSDTGVGMSKELLEKIFEPFFTTKEFGKGTGLGLSTIYGIVSQNRGHINVYSEPGVGSTFKIYLPCDPMRGDSDVLTSLRRFPMGKGETILMVEDEAAVLKMGRVMLEDLGYQVLTAKGPYDALTVSASYPGDIDLLLTDVIMPGMNGKEMADRLLAERPQMRCLYMSGFSAEKIASQGILVPGRDFIQKPFSIGDLAARVREVLG